MESDASENSTPCSSETEDEEQTESEKMRIRAELQTMSFEDLMKLKEKLGCKQYNKEVFGVSMKKNTKTFKRANKNRPREVSSKIKMHKKSLTQPKTKELASRDPRFDPLCGTFENKEFKKNYGFLKDVRKDEKKRLEEELKNAKDANSRRTIKGLLQRLDNQIREQEKREKLENEAREERAVIKEKLKKGEAPQFKMKSVKKIESFLAKYEELKKQNKLDKHIERRSKKLSGKEFRNMNKSIGSQIQ